MEYVIADILLWFKNIWGKRRISCDTKQRHVYVGKTTINHLYPTISHPSMVKCFFSCWQERKQKSRLEMQYEPRAPPIFTSVRSVSFLDDIMISHASNPIFPCVKTPTFQMLHRAFPCFRIQHGSTPNSVSPAAWSIPSGSSSNKTRTVLSSRFWNM